MRDDKGPHEGLGNDIKNVQSNHLTPLSSAEAPSVLKRRENRKMGEKRGIKKWWVRGMMGRGEGHRALHFSSQILDA